MAPVDARELTPAQPIKGASAVHTPERPTATVQEVYDLADAIQPRYRALVLLAGFLGLRWGGLVALRRRTSTLTGAPSVSVAPWPS